MKHLSFLLLVAVVGCKHEKPKTVELQGVWSNKLEMHPIDPPEVPFEPGLHHCTGKMSQVQRDEAMAWKKWEIPPMDASYDPKGKPGMGESFKFETGGRVYCPKGMLLSWDLEKVGAPPSYLDTTWAAHCYYVRVK